MVIKLANLDLPLDLVAWSVLDLDREVSTVVESAELWGRNGSPFNGSSPRSKHLGLLLSLIQRRNLTTITLTTLCEVCKKAVWLAISIAISVIQILVRDSSRNRSVIISWPKPILGCSWSPIKRYGCHLYEIFYLLTLVLATDCSAATRGAGSTTKVSFLGMCVAGKSPKAECCDLGNSLFSVVLKGLGPVLARTFFRWSSRIMPPAKFGLFCCIVFWFLSDVSK